MDRDEYTFLYDDSDKWNGDWTSPADRQLAEDCLLSIPSSLQMDNLALLKKNGLMGKRVKFSTGALSLGPQSVHASASATDAQLPPASSTTPTTPTPANTLPSDIDAPEDINTVDDQVTAIGALFPDDGTVDGTTIQEQTTTSNDFSVAATAIGTSFPDSTLPTTNCELPSTINTNDQDVPDDFSLMTLASKGTRSIKTATGNQFSDSSDSTVQTSGTSRPHSSTHPHHHPTTKESTNMDTDNGSYSTPQSLSSATSGTKRAPLDPSAMDDENDDPKRARHDRLDPIIMDLESEEQPPAPPHPHD